MYMPLYLSKKYSTVEDVPTVCMKYDLILSSVQKADKSQDKRGSQEPIFTLVERVVFIMLNPKLILLKSVCLQSDAAAKRRAFFLLSFVFYENI